MKKVFISILTVKFVLLAAVIYLNAQERPNINTLSTQDVFGELKKNEIFADEGLLDKTISETFSNRKDEAVGFAVNKLRSPRIEVIDGEQINRSDDFYLAKKVFKKFPNEAKALLEKEYASANPVLKANIVEMLASIHPSGEKPNVLLLDALNDTSFSEEEDPEMEGLALRVCDSAYNQLVLTHRVKGVLRAIGPMHRVNVRDYHIQILKNKLSK